MVDLSEFLDVYKKIPIICGPTASGKSGLALALCEATGGELVSCDSMQIYRGLDIGTAKDTPEEQLRVRHHMIDIVDPDATYSVSDFVRDASSSIQDILNRGKLPVLCGGTGQYITALYKGLEFGSEGIDDAIVDSLYEEYENDGIDGIYSKLQSVDPEAAEKIHPNNTRRVIRAYAVYLDSGITFTEKNKRSTATGPQFPFVLVQPGWDRSVLYDRVNMRVDEMISLGLVDEARWLFENYKDSGSTCLQAIGYKELFPYIKGEIGIDKAAYDIKLNTRHYAKRQLTWFRYMEVNVVDMEKNGQKIDPILSFVT